MKALNCILNSRNRVKRRGKKIFIVDATPVDLDFNFNRNKKTKEYLKTLNLKWSYSSSKGFYIGFKATVVIDYDSINHGCILIHFGAPSDAKLFDEIMENLQKRQIIQKEDTLILDKGYVRQEASFFSIEFSENGDIFNPCCVGFPPLKLLIQ